MDVREQDRCKLLILRYKRLEKPSIKNRAFLLMKPDLIKWIKSILGKRGKFLNDQEILSMIWDVFCKGVETYKEEYPIAKHFHITSVKYIRKKQFLENQLRKKEGDNEDIDLVEQTVDPSSCLDILMYIKSFFEMLPEDYQIVFEDALISLRPGNKGKINRVKDSGLPSHRYYESKKVFRWVINFLKSNY